MALRMTMKWLPRTREFRVRVLDGNTALTDYDYFSFAFDPSRQAKVDAWVDAMYTAERMAKRLEIDLPGGFGIQA